jgi:hypothetical protein
MLTWARWVSLVLAVSSLVAWAVVSGLRITYQGPSLGELASPGEPRRISDPTVYTVEPPVNLRTVRRADVALRIAAVLFVGVHLVILNMGRARPSDAPNNRTREPVPPREP